MTSLNLWLISVPNESSVEASVRKVSEKVSRDGWAKVTGFGVPSLKVGTLDILMQLSDDLVRLDQVGESMVAKLSTSLFSLLDRNPDKLESSLLVEEKSLRKYMEQFAWDEKKYPLRKAPSDIADDISKQLMELDAEMKTKLSAFNNLRTTFNALERKQVGNLLSRSLGDLVKPGDFVTDSEYLQTLAVVVPKTLTVEWNQKYERDLGSMVVPRSAKKIGEDTEYILYAVTLFKVSLEEFKQKARENRFIVRDFVYDAEDIEKERQDREETGSKFKKQQSTMLRWLKTNFSEAWVAWMHIKSIRIFTESVLRYGLPANFTAMTLDVNPKYEKKIRDALESLYGHLSSGGMVEVNNKDHDQEEAHLAGTTEFYPYVYFPINMDFSK